MYSYFKSTNAKKVSLIKKSLYCDCGTKVFYLSLKIFMLIIIRNKAKIFCSIYLFRKWMRVAPMIVPNIPHRISGSVTFHFIKFFFLYMKIATSALGINKNKFAL